MTPDGQPVRTQCADRQVLGQFVANIARFHNEAYGTILTPEHFHSYRFSNVW